LVTTIAKYPDWSNQQLAEHLGMSSETVRTHIYMSQVRLGVHSKAALVAWAFRRGLLDTGVDPQPS
jgi:DNA-binding NarL/FixJ family response regulator